MDSSVTKLYTVSSLTPETIISSIDLYSFDPPPLSFSKVFYDCQLLTAEMAKMMKVFLVSPYPTTLLFSECVITNAFFEAFVETIKSIPLTHLHFDACYLDDAVPETLADFLKNSSTTETITALSIQHTEIPPEGVQKILTSLEKCLYLTSVTLDGAEKKLQDFAAKHPSLVSLNGHIIEKNLSKNRIRLRLAVSSDLDSSMICSLTAQDAEHACACLIRSEDILVRVGKEEITVDGVVSPFEFSIVCSPEDQMQFIYKDAVYPTVYAKQVLAETVSILSLDEQVK